MSKRGVNVRVDVIVAINKSGGVGSDMVYGVRSDLVNGLPRNESSLIVRNSVLL